VRVKKTVLNPTTNNNNTHKPKDTVSYHQSDFKREEKIKFDTRITAPNFEEGRWRKVRERSYQTHRRLNSNDPGKRQRSKKRIW
jgi:hypothetical protein